ncbi:hypothetical protein, partial [Ligaoa zhengdingensis]|uniref:hypothetical protein n=1 Tax=Ligaoa zhengdingensis TaxID=2763658 RepID=UPI0031BB2DF7
MQGAEARYFRACLAISFYVDFYYRVNLGKNQGVLAKIGGEISAQGCPWGAMPRKTLVEAW